MDIKLTQDTIVRYEAGTALVVSEEEGKRLIGLGVAEEVKPKKKAKKGAE